MVNPHWDETINEDITVTDLPPWSPQQEWGDVGGGGEFTGWKGQEDPPSYRSDWQDYPADEFTGIQSNVPSGDGFLKNIFEKYGGNLGRLGGGFETPYGGGLLPWLNDDWGNKGRSRQEQDLLQKRKYDKYLEFMNQNQNRFNPEPGPWNEFNPRSRYGTVGEADWGEDLMAYRPGTYGVDYGDDDYGPFIPESVLEMDDMWPGLIWDGQKGRWESYDPDDIYGDYSGISVG